METDGPQVGRSEEALPIGGGFGGGWWGDPSWWTAVPGPEVSVDPPDSCVEGDRPRGCVWVGPKTVASSGFRVDGQMGVLPSGESEYHGSVGLPYTSLSRRKYGSLRVMVTREPGSTGAEGYVLRVFGEVPVTLWSFDLERGAHPGTGEIALLFDLQRLERGPKWADGRDLRVVMDTWSGAVRWERAQWWFGSGSWVEASRRGEAAMRCEWTGEGMRCRFEVALPLRAADLEPAAGARLAVGLGLVEVGDEWSGGRRGEDGGGGFPQELAERAQSEGADQASLDRTLLATVVFGEPPSVPLKVASFNVARFSKLESALTGSPFGTEVDVAEVAREIAHYDVVALQELWVRKDARALLQEVNRLRAERGLRPMRLYGPPRFERSELEYLLDRLPGVVETLISSNIPLGFVNTAEEILRTAIESGDIHGGTWVMTHLPVYGNGFQRFKDGGALLSNSRCRGEDCWKAKGVVWVRVGLHPVPPTGCALDPVSKEACGVPPTGDQFIDVFATHLQAKEPFLCGLELGKLAARSLHEVLWVGMTELMGGGDQCLSATDWGVQKAQLRQMADYVQAKSDGRRPALLLGDFNVDGRLLGNSHGAGEYARMLDILGVAPLDIDLGAEAPSDLLVADPGARDWDLDHGDVAREVREERWWTRCGVGTSIGKGGGEAYSEWEQGRCRASYWSEPSCQERWPLRAAMDEALCRGATYGCDLPRDKRLDYIFVRPPRRLGEAGWVPDYELGKDYLSSEPTWRTRFPERWPDASPFGPGVPVCGGAPDLETYPGRMSDHRLVEASLRFFRQKIPGRFQPDWSYRVTAWVESYDALDEDDCFLFCGVTDPYPVFNRSRSRDGLLFSEVEEHRAGFCQGRWAVSRGADACTDDWFVQFEAPFESPWRRHRVRFGIWEADDTSPEDHFSIGPVPRDVTWAVDRSWSGACFYDDEGSEMSGPWGDGCWPLLTTDPIRACFADEVRACVAIYWEAM